MIYVVGESYLVAKNYCEIDLKVSVSDPSVRVVWQTSQLRGAKITPEDEVHWVGDWYHHPAKRDEMEAMIYSRSHTR